MSRRRNSGFTLLELLVTLAVAAVLLGLAFPSLVATINRNRLSGGANELTAALQYARSEAIKRNARIDVCRSVDQATCSGGSGPWPGWVVVAADGNRDGNSNDPALLQSFTVKPPLELRSALSDGRVSYISDGYAHTTSSLRTPLLTTSFDLCVASTSPRENRRRVKLISGGRVSTEAINGNGTCT